MLCFMSQQVPISVKSQITPNPQCILDGATSAIATMTPDLILNRQHAQKIYARQFSSV